MSRKCSVFMGRELAFSGFRHFVRSSPDFLPEAASAVLYHGLSYHETSYDAMKRACNDATVIALRSNYCPVIIGQTRDGFEIQISKCEDGRYTTVSLLVECSEAALSITTDKGIEVPVELVRRFDIESDVWDEKAEYEDEREEPEAKKPQAARTPAIVGTPRCRYEGGTL